MSHCFKTIHLASLVSPSGDVSALCYLKPRAIALAKQSWTNRPEAVTCGRCTAKLREEVIQVLIDGDLAGLKPEERLALYQRVCESLGLNPLTKPFSYIRLNNKLTLYALKDFLSIEAMGKARMEKGATGYRKS